MLTRAKVRVRSFPLSVPCDPAVQGGGRWFGAYSVPMPTAGMVVPDIENFVEEF
jgi:hypothetical protein